jgi:DNA-binding CsgD family transcriptional regulator
MLSDWSFFEKHINKKLRSRLAKWIAERKQEAGWRFLPLRGWSAKTKKAEDGGMIVLAASNRELNTFVLVVDNLSSYETCKIIEPPIWDLQDLAGLLAPFAPSATAPQPPEKPFAGWRGGRPRRVLSDAEKAQIDAGRADGKTIDAIAKTMHISNRVVSAYLKMSK